MGAEPVINRRTLLRWAAVGGAAAVFRSPRAVAASDTITVAHVGVGGMGNAHVSWFAHHPDVRVAAICDVDRGRLESTLGRLKTLRPDDPVEGYTDLRRIMDRTDIDVVTTATPDHWHALVAMLAFESGKDVYGEKPLSRYHDEAVAMARLARRYGRVFQLGTQIHAGENYHRVVELVRSGALGRIHTARLWKSGGSPGLGFPADCDPPETLDWDLWLGPAPYRPYNPALQPGSFRHFWDYSGGVFADFWCHIADVLFWALAPGAPRTVESWGSTPSDGLAETPRDITVRLEFEGLTVEWTSHPPNVPGAAGREIGCQFVGERGTLVTDYGSRVIFLDGETLTDLPDVPRTIPRSPGHQRNFLDSVKSREQPQSNVDYALEMTTPLYLSLIAFRLGRKLVWDGARRCFVGDDAANRMLFRAYRPPWSIPA